LLYRVKFEKIGLAKYISHLDLNRMFMRAINRAAIDISYSEGFNPHQKITFASTLSLGVDSYCEFVDIKTEAEESAADIFERLSESMASDINIKEVYIPETAFKKIAATQYNIFADIKNADIANLEKMFAEEDILIEKKSKTKTERVAINKYIESIKFKHDGYIKIDAVLKSGNDLYLNPEYIIKAIGERFEIADYFIVKLDMFDGDGVQFR